MPNASRSAAVAAAAATLILAAVAHAAPRCAQVAATEVTGTLDLPSFVSDGMVLQRDTQILFAGRCRPGASVEIVTTWSARPTTAKAGEDGSFQALVTSLEAGGPHEVTITVEGEPPRVIGDVWLGEVWLASGQSNMEWSIAAARFDDLAPGLYGPAVAAAATPLVRFFDVPNEIDVSPRERCGGRWRVATADALPDFSAVGFHFACALQRELGVPIGIVQSDWGGTVAEAWTSEAKLREFGEFDADLDALGDLRAPSATGRPTLDDLRAAWWQNLEAHDVGLREAWFAPDLDTSAWEDTKVPGDPDTGFDGCFWLRREFEVPAAWAGLDLELSLGPIDDMDVVWYEGVRIGELTRWNNWNTPRTYTIPGALVAGGRASLCVLAVDPMGGAGLHGEPNSIFVRPVAAPANSALARIALDGTWRLRRGSALRALGAYPSEGPVGPNTPSVLHNAMIAPLRSIRLRGAIWYQGESNAGRPEQYARLLPALIADWRSLFRRAAHGSAGVPFPFGIVQIAPWDMPGDTSGAWSRLRMAQRALLPDALGLPDGMHRAALQDVGVVSIMDLGERDDIHPRRKLRVGERLADWALAEVYAETLPPTDVRKHRFELRAHRSPEPRSATRDDVPAALFAGATAGSDGQQAADAASVPVLRVVMQCFGHGELQEALTTSDGAAPTCFEIAGPDGVFHPAAARIVDVPAIARSPGTPGVPPIARALLLHSTQVADPTAVRFAWHAGDQPNLATTTGLAVGPFVARRTND